LLSRGKYFFLNLIYSLESRRIELELRRKLDLRIEFRRVNVKKSLRLSYLTLFR